MISKCKLRDYGKRILALMLACVMMLGASFQATTVSSNATTYTIVEVKKCYLPVYWSAWKASHSDDGSGWTIEGMVYHTMFKINGEIAYCMQSRVAAPTTVLQARTYDNEDILKTLYYGYNGYEQWEGFCDGSDCSEDEMGVIFMTELLTYYYSKADDYDDKGSDVAEEGVAKAYERIFGSGEESLNPNGIKINGVYLNDFYKFIESQDAVSDSVAYFSSTSVEAKWNKEEEYQYTDNITVLGEEGSVVTFVVPDNTTMVMSDGTTYKSGKTVTLKVGDVFYFKAELGVATGTVKVLGEDGSSTLRRNYDFSAIIFKTESNAQNMGQLYKVSDPVSTTSLSVTWLDAGYIEVDKYDSKTGELVTASSATFVIEDSDGYVVDTITTNKGTATSKLLADYTTYKVYESSSPENYTLTTATASQKIKTDGETYTKTFSNKPYVGSITITKEDSETGSRAQGDATLAGATYVLKAVAAIKDPATGDTIFAKGGTASHSNPQLFANTRQNSILFHT